jgi:hypothetical protein
MAAVGKEDCGEAREIGYRMYEKQKRYKARHKKLFLCVNCASRATHGIHCEPCAKKNRERANRLMPGIKKKRIEQGRCRSCGAPLVDGEYHCCAMCNSNRRGEFSYAKNRA